MKFSLFLKTLLLALPVWQDNPTENTLLHECLQHISVTEI